MTSVLVDAHDLIALRLVTAALVEPGKRLHFHQELDRTRRVALEAFASMPIRASAVVAIRSHGVTEFQAREHCLRHIVEDLQARSVPRLTIESRQDDRDDQRTIARARTRHPPLVFEHRDAAVEPLLWIADGITWAIGTGGRWAALVEPVMETVTEIRA